MNRFIYIFWCTGDSPKIGSTTMNDDGRSGLNGFFRNEGLVCLIDGKGMKNVEIISHFICSLVDRAWREAHAAYITFV